MRKLLTEEQMLFIRLYAKGRNIAELTALFNKRFSTAMRISQIESIRYRYGLLGCFNTRYTPEMMDFIRQNINGTTFRKLTELINSRFGINATEKQIRGICIYHKLKNNLRPGHCHKPVGSERKGPQGYINVRFQHTGNHLKDWKPKHIFLWEQAHGPIPAGNCVMFADGNKNNCAIDNLLLVTTRELLTMKAFKYPIINKELTKAGILSVRLNSAIKNSIRNGKDTGGAL